MTVTLALFFAVGLIFGLLTYRRRHFFSEGGARPTADGGFMEGRLMWSALCSCLWPIFAATGAWNLVRLSGRAAAGRSK